ncbi:MAG: hypothetical protein ACQEQF_12435 [Bacillota bacterium]
MRFYEKKVLNSEEVEKIMNLPEELKNQKLEVIILNIENEKEKSAQKEDTKNIISELKGAYKGELSTSREYTNQKKIEKELENRKFKNE